MKKFALLAAILLASLLCIPVAGAATGTATASTSMGTFSLNVAGGSNFAVNTHAVAMAGANPMSQSTFEGEVCSAANVFLGDTTCNGVDPIPADEQAKLDIYVDACYYLAFVSATPTVQFTDDPGWSCGQVDTGPLASQNVIDVPAHPVVTNLAAWPLDGCSMLTIGNGVCIPGDPSGLLPTPNLDNLVGAQVVFYIETNWCDFIAPAGYLGAPDATGVGPLGCANQSATLGAASQTAASTDTSRTLAATNPFSTQVSVKVQASPFDCHIPRVKGLTLRRAKARLLSHNCRLGRIRRVSGERVGRIKYQPLRVGVGRPRGFKVKLAVVK